MEVAKLLSKSPVQLTGLGARDSLRLEAGMCLYGNDLCEDTTPIEAGLSWVIGKDRRENGNFIGAGTVRKHLKDGPPRRRVGMIVAGAPARRTYPLQWEFFIWCIDQSTPKYLLQLQAIYLVSIDDMKVDELNLTSRLRYGHVRYSKSNLGKEHCHGICENWLA